MTTALVITSLNGLTSVQSLLGLLRHVAGKCFIGVGCIGLRSGCGSKCFICFALACSSWLVSWIAAIHHTYSACSLAVTCVRGCRKQAPCFHALHECMPTNAAVVSCFPFDFTGRPRKRHIVGGHVNTVGTVARCCWFGQCVHSV